MAVAEEKGIQSDLIPKIATGFCSGIARTSNQCGAVSGAIMAISMCKGRSTPEDSVEEIYNLVKELIEDFTTKYGSTNCRQLIQVDLSTEVGQTEFREQSKFVDCLLYAETATELALSFV